MRSTKLLLLALCFIVSANADTHTALSPSRQHVSDQVTAAADGDTILIPAGPATWTSTLTVNKWLKFQGAGMDQTVITINVPNPGQQDDLGGLVLQGNGTNEVSHIGFKGASVVAACPLLCIWSGPACRVHHCRFQTAKRGITVAGAFGVIDHNEFSNLGGSVRINGWAAGKVNWDTYYPIPFTSNNYLFIENNTFTVDSGLGAIGINDFAWCSSGQGSSYVVRYNTFFQTFGHASCCFDWHGDQQEDFTRGNLSSQIYCNTFTVSSGAYIDMFANARGGQSLLYSNTVTASSSFNTAVREEYPAGSLIGGVRYWDVVTNMWHWANTRNGTAFNAVCDSPGTACTLVDYHNTPYLGSFTQTYPHPMVSGSSPPEDPPEDPPAEPEPNPVPTETEGMAISRSGIWFTNKAGKAVVLTGSHTWTDLCDVPARSYTFDYTEFLNYLQATNQNFFRMWVPDYYPANNYSPMVYNRPGPGNSVDGGLKWDLTSFNQTYFDRLSNRVSQAASRGIYCGVMLFQGFWFHDDNSPDAWPRHFYNPANNVNGQGLTSSQVYMLDNAAWLGTMTNYVRKVIDTVGMFENVLYEIGNEMPGQSRDFQVYMVDMIRAYEATLGYSHPVGITSLDYYAANTESFDTDAWIDSTTADWCSYYAPTYTDDMPAWAKTKVHVLDTDHIWGIGGTIRWVPEAFCRGYNPIYMDPFGAPWNSDAPDVGMRKAMGLVRRVADKVDLASMTPGGQHTYTGYALTNAANEYIAYATNAAGTTTHVPVGWYWVERWQPSTGLTSSDPARPNRLHYAYDGLIDYACPSGWSDALFVIRPCRPDAGIEFDGVDDSVSCGTGINNLSTLTVSAWILPRFQNAGAGGTYGRIFCKEPAGGSHLLFFLTDTNNLCFTRAFSTARGLWISLNNVLTTNNWQHVAVTYTGSTSADPIFYVNGVAKTTSESEAPSGSLSDDSAAPIYIGNRQAGGRGFNGMISEVRVYNRVLAAGEVAVLANSRMTGYATTYGLVGYWPLTDGAAGTSAHNGVCRDRSGGGHPGTPSYGANATGCTWRGFGGLISGD